jgi:hypothetical protein
MQAWRIFGGRGLVDSLQCEDTLDFNVFTCKTDFDKIHNTSWVLQPVNKIIIVFFYYKFMLMTT